MCVCLFVCVYVCVCIHIERKKRRTGEKEQKVKAFLSFFFCPQYADQLSGMLCVCVCVCVYMFVYIYREKGREKRERERESKRSRLVCPLAAAPSAPIKS